MKLVMRGSNGLNYVTQVLDDLGDQGDLLLRQIVDKAPELAGDGSRVRLDWGIIKLARRGDEIWVEEPNYREQPRCFVPGINFTCAVLRAQQCVHDRLGAGAQPVYYDQFMLVYPGGLKATRIAAIRHAAEQPDDSGWRIFDVSQIDWAAPPQARRVYEVAGKRPALMAVLSLPVGWAVQLDHETLIEAAHPDGERIKVGISFEIP